MNQAQTQTCTLGVIIGNRGFFPDHLAKSGREEMIAALKRAGIEAVVLGPERSKFGAVETRAEARHAPTCSSATATRSTASSFHCPISVRNAAWWRRSAWPACMCRC